MTHPVSGSFVTFRTLRFLFAVLLLYAANPVWAAGTTGSLSGQVTAAGTSPLQPVAGATVRLYRDETLIASTMTDASGAYAIASVPAGEYNIKIAGPGDLFDNRHFNLHVTAGGSLTDNVSLLPELEATSLCSANPAVSRHWGLHNPLPYPVSYAWTLKGTNVTGSGVATSGDSTFDTPAAGQSNHLQIFVALKVVDSIEGKGKTCPTGSIGGAVTDNATSPNGLGNVQINVTDATGNNVATGMTQADGTYAFASLIQGTYSLAFTKAGYNDVNITNVTVVAGATTTRNIVMFVVAPPPLASVDVAVSEDSANSPPIIGATVTITYTGGANPAPQTTDGNGLAQFVNQPVNGSGSITVMTNDGSNRTASIVFTSLASGPNPFAVGIAPIPRGSVSGVVTDNNTPPVSLGLVQVSVLDGNSNTIATASTLADGSYSISAIVAGSYNLQFALHNYTTVSVPIVITNGGNSTQNEMLTPLPGTLPATLNLTALDSNGVALAKATVTLSYAGAPSPAPSGITDGTGAILFDGSNAPGLLNGLTVTYTVVANDCFGSTVTQTVTLASDGGPNPVTAVINAAPTGILAGIVGPGGLSGVLVSVVDANNNTVASATTDGSGNFSISSLETCTYTVNFTPPSAYQNLSVPNVVITAGNITTQSPTLTPLPNPMDATVTITVTSGGNPAGGATVTIDYGSSNPPSGPSIGQTDPATGQVQFTNQIVGVAATISVMLADGVTQLPAQTSTFQSGSTASGNNLSFAQ